MTRPSAAAARRRAATMRRPWCGRAALVALLAVLGSPHAGLAATPSNQVPVGPRAIGMGGAFSAIADDATALYWNPAGLATVGHQEVDASYANRFDTGLRDNLVSFLAPLSPNLAFATDWYHSGFDDNELGFSENRVTLGAGLKVSPWLWAGAGAKLLARNTSLDGLSVTSGRGFGLDVGLLAAPLDRLRVGLVGQDLTGTDLRTSDGQSSEAYPRNWRLASAYTWRKYGTVALDVDDRWHLGVEATPHPLVALRAGVEQDRNGDESATWSMGLGFKVGMLRLDWARNMPPILPATDYFGLSLAFNFNPAQLRIEKVQPQEVYTSLYKAYAREGFGSVQVRNLQDRPLTARVGVFIPELMSAPSEQDVTVRPKAVSEFPLTAVLDEKVLTQRGDQPIQVQVTASYQSLRLERHEKAAGRTVAYAPGAIDWGLGMAQAAAWVTPRDPAVDELARQAGRLALTLEGNPFGNRNIAFAAAMTDALKELGVAYVPDPNNPFATVSTTPHAVDTIHYPYQTIDRLSGDCDDTSVLMASMLGNVGVNTCFVDVPGHIFVLVDTGLPERSRSALGADSTMIVISKEEVWIPLETTSLQKGFTQAWRDGADEIQAASARDSVNYYDVTASQERYEPSMPPGDRHIRLLDEARFSARLADEAKTISAMRDEYFATQYGVDARKMEESADALEQVARVDFEGDDLEGARGQLESALAKAPQSASAHNNLGVVLASMDSLRAADEHWSTAIALGARGPGVALNRGLCRWAAGDSVSAGRMLGPAVADAGGYAAACRLIGLAPEDSLDRAAGLASEDLTLRSRIRNVLRENAIGGGAKPHAGARPSSAEVTPPSTSVRGIGKYLYWIE
jgi:transglutaminase-like putative cysteine protease/tetratricopeptide (TPR) repeat protein